MTKSGKRWELYDPISENYHDQNRCKQVEDKRKKAEAEAKRLKPTIIHKRKDYFKTEHFDKPLPSDFGVQKICYCSETECYPTMLQEPKYFFSTDELMSVSYTFWCSNCGYHLSNAQTENYFNKELLAINKWR